MTVLRLAVLSGMLGASASCLAKFALAPESPVAQWALRLCDESLRDGKWTVNDIQATCDVVSLLPRGLCVVAMVSLNIIMVGTFLEGMQESGSVAATSLASAANFATSALFGIFLWGESVTETWFLGFVLVLSGVALLSSVQLQPPGAPS